MSHLQGSSNPRRMPASVRCIVKQEKSMGSDWFRRHDIRQQGLQLQCCMVPVTVPTAVSCTTLKQVRVLTNSTTLSIVCSQQQRGLAGNVSGLYTGPMTEEQLHTVQVVVESSNMQGCAPSMVPQVYNQWPEVSNQQLQALLTALEAERMTVSNSAHNLACNEAVFSHMTFALGFTLFHNFTQFIPQEWPQNSQCIFITKKYDDPLKHNSSSMFHQL